MRIDIVTIFPQMFESPFSDSILKRAQEKGVVEFHFHDIRKFTKDKHRSVDDTPYGGGAGMVMTPEPIVSAVESVKEIGSLQRVLLTPRGEVFSQRIAKELTSFDQLVLICGRYEGIDERAHDSIAARELSIGDYVISGGEVAAMVVVEAVVRLLPGALGNEESAKTESFEGALLEHPQFTKPREFRGQTVPDVLLNGNHAEIEAWRRRESLLRTAKKRPDLLKNADLTAEEKRYLVDKLGLTV